MRGWIPTVLMMMIAVACFAAPGFTTSEVEPQTTADLVAIYRAALESVVSEAEGDLFVGIGRRLRDLSDPPAGVLEGVDRAIYPVSRVDEISLKHGVHSSLSPAAGEIVYFDILRVDEGRAYVLMRRFRSGLNSSENMLTLIPLGPEEWVVVHQCRISTS